MPSYLSFQCLTLIIKTKGSFETPVCTGRHGVILWRRGRQQHSSDDVKSPSSALLYLRVNL
jgi:hypothetical protein